MMMKYGVKFIKLFILVIIIAASLIGESTANAQTPCDNASFYIKSGKAQESKTEVIVTPANAKNIVVEVKFAPTTSWGGSNCPGYGRVFYRWSNTTDPISMNGAVPVTFNPFKSAPKQGKYEIVLQLSTDQSFASTYLEKTVAAVIASDISNPPTTPPGETCQYKGEPVQKDKVIKYSPAGIKKDGTSEKDIIAVIKSNGTNFEMTSAVEAEFKKAGVSAAIIKAAKDNYRGTSCDKTAGSSNANSNTAAQVNTSVGVSMSGSLDDNLGYFFNPLEKETLPQLFASILRILFVLIGTVAVIIIIIAGFRMVMSSGNEAELTKAKQALTWAIVGLIVALMSFSIVAIVQKLIQG